MPATDRGRVVVSGGSGFIGSALVRRLVSESIHTVNLDALTYAAVPEALSQVTDDDNYTFIQCDLRNERHVTEVIGEVEPTAVMHLAAETHVDRSIDDPAAFVDTNVRGSYNLLAASHRYWEGLAPAARETFRFLHVSTDEVFGSTSDQFRLDSPYRPRSPYAASKAAADHFARAWFHTYGMPVIVTNCSNNYGPWQFPEKLIPRLVTRALTGRSLPVYGDGLHQRDWLHVEDHVAGLAEAISRGVPGSTYLFGSERSIPNIDLVHMIADALDKATEKPAGYHRGQIEEVPDRPGHDRRYAIDASSAKNGLGWNPRVALADGVGATVSWYVNNSHWWEAILANRYDTRRLGAI